MNSITQVYSCIGRTFVPIRRRTVVLDPLVQFTAGRRSGAPPVDAYHRCVVELRSMTIDDVAWIVRWDDDPDVAAAIGGPAADWFDWPAELVRDVAWRELLIAEDNGRPIGFVQLTDACEEESHYWGAIEPGTWALDIWIGSPDDRGHGLGAEAMKAALGRAFDRHGAEAVVIDPMVGNRRAIAFYDKLGFERVGVREFGDHECLVMRLPATRAGRLRPRST